MGNKRTLIRLIFQCRLFGDDPVPETRCARPRRRPHHRRRRRGGRIIIIIVRRERPNSIVAREPDSAQTKSATSATAASRAAPPRRLERASGSLCWRCAALGSASRARESQPMRLTRVEPMMFFQIAPRS